MNMSITAKTDSMTVFMQLVMLLFLLLYIRRQRSAYLVLAVDAYPDDTRVKSQRHLYFQRWPLERRALYPASRDS